jgi:hypothetical protein
MDQQIQDRVEALGPAERTIAALTTFTDHMVHNRPGMVSKSPGASTGVRWEPVIWKEEDGQKVVYKPVKQGNRRTRARVGTMNGTNEVRDGRTVVGEYRKPGLLKETVEYCYRQIAEVWKMDNEFAAHWASWAFPREHRDLKVLLAAFMLVQDRKGDPVVEDGKVLFKDEDYRDVGEAMCLLREGKNDINPKLLLRVGDVLALPEVAAINRELGFGRSARNPAMGRYVKVVEKWLRFREENPPMLEGLVKAGYRTTVMRLAQRIGYKPTSEKFFEVLRWPQKQAKDGRRAIAVGKAVRKAQTWEGKTEREICEIISKEKPNWKKAAGMLPKKVGMTRAILAAAVEAGCMSGADLIILTPTLEEMGLLKVKSVADRWKLATTQAENQRAANIARNVKTKEAREGLQAAADKATEKAFEQVTKDLRVYVVVDKSGSMEASLEKAKGYLTRFLAGFPLDRLHVAVFNTMGTEVTIRAPQAAAVEHAFRGHRAGGGTSYANGFAVLSKYRPKPEEDSIVIFVGDEGDDNPGALVNMVQASGVNPVAFGLLRVDASRANWNGGSVVRTAAARLGIPCFKVDENMFTSDDPYAVTRMFRDLIAATPVGAPQNAVVKARKTLVQEILETKLLQKPVWA